MGYSPWGAKEVDRAERLNNTTWHLHCISTVANLEMI